MIPGLNYTSIPRDHRDPGKLISFLIGFDWGYFGWIGKVYSRIQKGDKLLGGRIIKSVF